MSPASDTAIRQIVVTEFEYRVPEGAGGGTLRKFAVQVRAEDGNEGQYVALWSAPPLAVPQVVAAARMLLGTDYREREKLWDRVNRGHAKHDRIGYGALDIALWDLAGKAVDQPVWALLGGFRDRLPAYVSTVGGIKGKGTLGSAAAYADYAEECLSKGAIAYKFHGF
jgi:L-alanine-DL-glutamate epimerase-like enolase superfamily enzyme